MTVISFVGLFVLMYTDGIGYHIIFPHFTMVPAHPSIIAYRTTDRPSGSAGGTWQQMTDTITIDGVQYNYVQVSKQNIAILNSSGGTPPVIGFALPRLTCCCPPYWDGFLNDYGNPNSPAADKKSAHVYLNNASSVGPTNIPSTSSAVSTQFQVPSTTGITIQGTIGGSVKTIVLNPGAQVIFGNTPISVLDGTYSGPPDDEHFRAYYKMGRMTSSCTAIPSEGGACAPSTASCPNFGSAAKTKSAKRSTTAKSKKGAATNPTATAHAAHGKSRSGRFSDMVDVDCSNSQYP